MNKVNYHFDYIEFPANSIEELNRSRDFFASAFGWSFQQWGDDYTDTKDSGVSSGISADTPTSAPLPVIYASDIEEAYKKVQSAGGSITKDIFSFPGGKRFHFQDPSGNELAVWSD